MGVRLLATRSAMRRLVGDGVDLYPKTKCCGVAATSNTWRLQQLGYYCSTSRLPSFAIGCYHNIHTTTIPSSLHISSSLYYSNQKLHNTIQKYHQSSSTLLLLPQTQQTQQTQQCRHLSSRRKKKGVDTNEPLINEHLIAELFNISKDRKNNDNSSITADSYEVRLIVDMGHDKKKKKKIKKEKDDDNDDSSLEEEEEEDSSSSTTTNQLTTLNEAISIAHKHSLDLMAVNITNVTPPVIKAVNYDKWLYEQKKNAITKSKKKKMNNNNSIGGGGGGGAISDKSLKEYKFRAGIDQHDLERKANNMIKYLKKGHAIRVTLTARYKSLNQDADAISTTLERVKELVGDLAIEARGMKANDRKSYGSLLFHPNLKKK